MFIVNQLAAFNREDFYCGVTYNKKTFYEFCFVFLCTSKKQNLLDVYNVFVGLQDAGQRIENI